jgi:hypothetical protein
MVLIPRGSAVGVGSRVYCIYRIPVKRIVGGSEVFALYSPVVEEREIWSIVRHTKK